MIENSFITYSDVHQDWSHVGAAIKDTIMASDGFIPALIISTGDYHNGHGEVTIEDTLKDLYSVHAQIAGIDVVWVTGNHERGTGATTMNFVNPFADDLTEIFDEEEKVTGTGIIFDTRSDAYAENAESSLFVDDLVVIGINYDDVKALGGFDYGTAETEGPCVYAYLKNALDKVAADYNGQLVVISAHAGLHVVGGSFSGGGSYNINNSDAVVDLINSYADDYNMDIMFFFGHDHSKGESELHLLPGDTIQSTVNFDASSYREIPLSFTYGQAGYIGDKIGAGQGFYSFVKWDDDSIARILANSTKDAESEKINIDETFFVDRISDKIYDPVLTFEDNGTRVAVEHFREGLYARVAFVIEKADGETGLYVTQVGIIEVGDGSYGSIELPAFNVPGLTVKGINVSLVDDVADISAQEFEPIATASVFFGCGNIF